MQVIAAEERLNKFYSCTFLLPSRVPAVCYPCQIRVDKDYETCNIQIRIIHSTISIRNFGTQISFFSLGTSKWNKMNFPNNPPLIRNGLLKNTLIRHSEPVRPFSAYHLASRFNHRIHRGNRRSKKPFTGSDYHGDTH